MSDGRFKIAEEVFVVDVDDGHLLYAPFEGVISRLAPQTAAELRSGQSSASRPGSDDQVHDQPRRRLRKGTTPEELSRMVRRLRQRDVGLVASLIVFEPRSTLDELDESLRWLDEHRLYRSFSLTTLIPFRNTLAHRELRTQVIAEPSTSFAPLGYRFTEPDVDRIYRAAVAREADHEQWSDGALERLMRCRFAFEERLGLGPEPPELRDLDAYRARQIAAILDDIRRLRR
ncbi:hypothetical protein ACIA5H_08035 [Nocardia sp. NPDC051900]|uniref:hypothetical protein n=1 Tax=Nocardia sp. NPDC051900 TaxID=3364326 RepID=UPI00379ED454